MLNHGRTLLANVQTAGDLTIYDEIAEESGSPYAPLPLPGSLQAVRRVLFGSDPDRAMINYRARQFMTLLHAGPYVEYVTALDARVNYAVGEKAQLLSPVVFMPVVSYLAGTVGRLLVGGAPLPPDVNGKVLYDFKVAVDSPTSVTVWRVVPYPESVTLDFALAAGESGELPLSGSGYTFKLTTDEPGASWHVVVRNRPQFDLADLVEALDSLGEPTMLDLFSRGVGEPWATFLRLWQRARTLPERMAGLLLALVYRTDAIWRQRNG